MRQSFRSGMICACPRRFSVSSCLLWRRKLTLSTARSWGMEVKRDVTSKDIITSFGRRLTPLSVSKNWIDEQTVVSESAVRNVRR
ncbi:unnamed protein product [Schistocephalus solidus]|uniref:Uncharacterized protein n=1 Tax=Schistocephalus solidus TaxID=70667 RepID=A0A3P7C401_SCHSO|nr:unnamed protein product [Schistocephalus solidus]